MIISFSLLFVILISGSFLAAAVFRCRFEETLPISIDWIPAVLFFGGLAFGLQAAFILALCLAGGMIVFSILFVIRSRTGREAVRRLFTPGFLLFLLLFLGLIFVHHGRLASGFDEFSHWMDVVKAMTRANGFGTDAAFHLSFPSYPPGMALFQYFFQKVYLLVHPGAGFTEWLCYPAYQLLAFSFFFPVFRKVTWKQVIPAAFLLILCCLGVTALYDYALVNTYIDPFLGIVTGAGFALLFLREKDDRIADATLLVILFTLVMAKDTGLFCAGVLGIAAGICKLLECGKKGKRKPASALLYILLIATCIAIPKLLWKAHYTAAGAAQSFSQPVDWKTVWEILTGTNIGWQGEGFAHYLNALWTEQVEIGSTGLKITYPILLVILTTVLAFLTICHRKEEGKGQRRTAVITAVCMVLFYSVGLGFIYLFKFGQSGTMKLLSFERYLRVPFLAMLVMAALLLIRWWMTNPKGKWIWLALLCAAGIIILPLGKTKALLDRSSVAEASVFRTPYDALAEQVLEDTRGKEAKVFIISQHDGGWDYYTLRFSLRPCDSTGWTLAPEGAGEEGLIRCSGEEWKESLKAYDYVIVYRADNAFMEEYGILFAGTKDYTNPIQQQTVYKVDHDREKLVRLGMDPGEISEDAFQYVGGMMMWFDSEGNTPAEIQTSGLSVPEAGYVWSEGTESVISMKIGTEAGKDLSGVWTYCMTNGVQWCSIEVGDELVFDDVLSEGRNTISFDIPASAVSGDGRLEIRFIFPDAREPGNGDGRRLAAAFEKLRIQEQE